MLEVSNRVKTEMEWASVATGYTSHTLLLLQGHALGVLDMVLDMVLNMDVYQGSSSLEGPEIWILSLFLQEVFNSVSSSSSLWLFSTY